LESALTPQGDRAAYLRSWEITKTLYERRKRRHEAESRPFTDPPPDPIQWPFPNDVDRRNVAAGEKATRGQADSGADTMKTVTKRIARLEEHLQITLTPRKRLSIVVMRVDRKPSLEGATCTRTLCPDGTLMQVIHLDQSRPGREGTHRRGIGTIETFPIDRMRQS
jgi:hypothetical protein